MASATPPTSSAPNLATELAEATRLQERQQALQYCEQLFELLPTPMQQALEKIKKSEEEKKQLEQAKEEQCQLAEKAQDETPKVTREMLREFTPDLYETARNNLEYLIEVAKMTSPNSYHRPVQEAIETDLCPHLKSLIDFFEQHIPSLTIEEKKQILKQIFNIRLYRFETVDLSQITKQIRNTIEQSDEQRRSPSPHTGYKRLLIQVAEEHREVTQETLYNVYKRNEALSDQLFLCELLDKAIRNGSDTVLELIADYIKEKGYRDPLLPPTPSSRSFWKDMLARSTETQKQCVSTLKSLVSACNSQEELLLHKLVEKESLTAMKFLRSMEPDVLVQRDDMSLFNFDKDSVPTSAFTDPTKAQAVNTSDLDFEWLAVTEIAAVAAPIDWNVRNPQGLRPIDLAIIHQHQPVTELLVSYNGFDAIFTPNARTKENIFHILVLKNSNEAIAFVADLAATKEQKKYLTLKLKQQDIRGDTPLHLAYLHQRYAIVQELTKLKANTKIKNNIGKRPEEMSKATYTRT
ncbi:ankyrin repeat domain-containing protein [Parashewanella tropica]|uniref:ankyrin repeat domain-containing protein n=1 Tax=Parashewanella tropica TaxID=2547970 RepID=UPI00105A471A|nr:ankyrin repeat domain-containing protein [Parashewanella tropica]